MNTFSVKINGIDYSRKVYFAPKWANLLDERLDEGYIFMKGVTVNNFAPLSFVEVTFINHPSAKIYSTKPAKQGVIQDLQLDGSLKQTEIKKFLVATDNAEEYPVGSGKYTHSLYLIEATKYAERLIGDSLYFSNTKGVVYADVKTTLSVTYPVERTVYSNIYKSLLPLDNNNNAYIYTPSYLYSHEDFSWTDGADAQSDLGVVLGNTPYQKRLTIELKEITTGTVSTIYEGAVASGALPDLPQGDTINIGIKPYGSYVLYIEYTYDGNLHLWRFSYPVSIGKSLKPLKPWTLTEAITRCCELIEPLRSHKGDGVEITSIEKPRFKLDGVNYNGNGIRIANTQGSQAEKYDKVFIPTMALTKCTFREQLQQLAKIAHSEPRIEVYADHDELVSFVIYLDEYGNRDKWETNKKYIEKSASQAIDDFCTTLDSQANNFVNTLDEDEAAVIDPYQGGGRSLRVDTVSARIEDNNAIALTVLPIYKIIKLECRARTNDTNHPYSAYKDITDFVFEKAAYDNLSSYDGAYPFVKGYALYYTQGTPNIYGLWFKPENPVSVAWWSKYAIVNIMNAVLAASNKTMYEDDYPSIQFRITYQPVFGQRVRQSKTKIGQTKSQLTYNQGANLIETRYFGDNLKGVVSRLGNVEKSVTYKFAYLSEIPKAGQIYGDGRYYISAINVEYTPNFIKATLALSKDFNRYSEYVGINKENRLFEVSEKQAQERDSIYSETLLVSMSPYQGDNDTLLSTSGMRAIYKIFNFADNSVPAQRITSAKVWGENKDGTEIFNYKVSLPVVSSAFGNSMAFTFKFDNNYSAGQQSILTDNGRFGDNVPYCDSYGRFWWLCFSLEENPRYNENNPFSLPITPGTATTIFAHTYDSGILYRKNGEEIPSFTYQLDIKTDEESIVIGSAFARLCPLVNGQVPPALRLYVIPDEIPLFKDRLSPEYLTGLTDLRVSATIDDMDVKISNLTAPNNGKAWVILTPSRQETKTYANDNGEETPPITIEKGYEIVLGRNIPITTGNTIILPHIAVKKETT